MHEQWRSNGVKKKGWKNDRKQRNGGYAILSLFDGISCGQIALERASIPIKVYYSSEIDENAIAVTQKNYPKTIQLGDVEKIDFTKFKGKIDLLIGGSPCQGFSYAGKQLNFQDSRSKLFFEFVRALKEVKPKYFLLENVKMKKEYQDIISQYLQVEPIEINSALVSAQNRKRLYWTNIPIEKLPNDKEINIKDILQNIEHETIDMNKFKNPINKKSYIQYDINGKGYGSQDQRAFYLDGKCGTLDTSCKRKAKFFDGKNVCYFTRNELERLQTLPDNYTSEISESKAAFAIGNGWTVDVIAHIFKGLK